MFAPTSSTRPLYHLMMNETLIGYDGIGHTGREKTHSEPDIRLKSSGKSFQEKC
jgi:hypothetical protein